MTVIEPKTETLQCDCCGLTFTVPKEQREHAFALSMRPRSPLTGHALDLSFPDLCTSCYASYYDAVVNTLSGTSYKGDESHDTTVSAGPDGGH